MCIAHYIRNKRYGNPLGHACKMQGCTSPVYAKHLCKYHYHQDWNQNAAAHQDESIESLLEKARAAYDQVTGLQNRIRWHKEISELEAQLQQEQERMLQNV
jgi:hypothetical protein